MNFFLCLRDAFGILIVYMPLLVGMRYQLSMLRYAKIWTMREYVDSGAGKRDILVFNTAIISNDVVFLLSIVY